MKRIFELLLAALPVVVFLTAFAKLALAAPDLPVLSDPGLPGKLVRQSPESRRQFYRDNRLRFQELSREGGSVEAYLRVTDLRHASEEAIVETRKALAALIERGDKLTEKEAKEIVARLVDAASKMDEASPQRPALLYQLGKVLEKLTSLGLGLAEYTENNPRLSEFLEKVLKYAKAVDALDELRRTGKVNVDKFINDLIGLLPARMAPGLTGPARVFLRDLLKWDQEMWDSTTEGVDLVADAIKNGQMDMDRYNQLSNRLNDLAKKGPWDSDTARDFVKEMLVGVMPGAEKLFEAFWPSSADVWAGNWSTTRGGIDIVGQSGGLVAVPVSGDYLDRYDGKVQIQRATTTRLEGIWSIRVSRRLSLGGTFYWDYFWDNGRNRASFVGEFTEGKRIRPWRGHR